MTRPTLEFTIPVATPLLNEWQRMHFLPRGRMKLNMAWHVRAAVGAWNKPPIQKCRIEIDRHSAGLPDWDGLYGGLKPLLDVLTKHNNSTNPHGLGIIEDDSPKIITKLVALPVKGKQRQGKTVVRIYAAE